MIAAITDTNSSELDSTPIPVTSEAMAVILALAIASEECNEGVNALMCKFFSQLCQEAPDIARLAIDDVCNGRGYRRKWMSGNRKVQIALLRKLTGCAIHEAEGFLSGGSMTRSGT